MEGYKYRTGNILYKDMIAAYDENGEMMSFENIKGKSILLTAEEVGATIYKIKF